MSSVCSASSLAPYDPKEFDASSQFSAPAARTLLAPTSFGHDMFSRILTGAQIDLKFGVIVLLLGFIPGVVLGIISGYAGGWVDYADPALGRGVDGVSRSSSCC